MEPAIYSLRTWIQTARDLSCESIERDLRALCLNSGYSIIGGAYTAHATLLLLEHGAHIAIHHYQAIQHSTDLPAIYLELCSQAQEPYERFIRNLSRLPGIQRTVIDVSYGPDGADTCA